MVPVGKHSGRIVEAELRKSQKDNAHPYAFLRFAVGQDRVDYFGSFSPKVIEQGKSAGKRVGDLTAETLVNLGWEGDFNKFSELIDVESDIVVEHQTDESGRTSARVKFINPTGGGTPADAGDVATLAKSFRAAVVEAKKKRPAIPPRKAAGASGSAGGVNRPPVDTSYDEYDSRGDDPF